MDGKRPHKSARIGGRDMVEAIEAESATQRGNGIL